MVLALKSGVQHALGLRRRTPPLPAEEHTRVFPPRPDKLVDAYLEHLDATSWGDSVPPHMFPQWAFSMVLRCLSETPYPLLSGLNGGCRLEVKGRLRRGLPLRVRARLESVEERPRKMVLETRVVTGTDEVPEALVAHYAIVVPRRDGPKTKEVRGPVLVAPDSLRLRTEELGTRAARDFAKLTGDLNPIHWSPSAARAAGFPNVILHGFSTMARTYEALVEQRFGGDPHGLRRLEVRFTRPLVLPARVGIFASKDQVFVGGEAGEPAYLVGTYA